MIGDDIAAIMPLLRLQAQSMQTSTVQIVRRDHFGAPDPATGVVQQVETVVYAGPARVKPMKRITAGGVDIGGILASSNIYIVSIPATVAGVNPGDVVRTLASPDTDLLTVALRVMEISGSPEATARRLTCERIESRQA